MKRKPKPPVHIYDPAFVWRDSSKTDVAATFKRVRERLAAEAMKADAIVTTIKRRA